VKKINWLTDEEYEFIFRRTPRLCVDLIVFDRDGFVLGKRDINPFRGKWSIPGGRVGYKESVSAAIKRIAKAELGIAVSNPTLVGYIDFLRDGPWLHSVSMVFCATIASGTVRGSAQAQKVRSFSEIPRDMHPMHRKFLRDNWEKIFEPQ
jgi:8-oxo-dGTP diphosphatase